MRVVQPEPSQEPDQPPQQRREPASSVPAHESPQPRKDVSRPSVSVGRLRGIKPRDYAIRFIFGGVISVIAALLGKWVNPLYGGVWTGFPAILVASLTLIGKEDGEQQSAQDAEGGVVGALAFIGAAVFIALTLTHISGAASLLLALALWLALAVGLYLLVTRLGWLRTYTSDGKQQ